ncbi:MAG: DNA double-strand break repair nuclease NurA [Anaerolineales bacterium]|nr:DNA double-strand break repair nuclease NurA [Anaerolineales bacterium]
MPINYLDLRQQAKAEALKAKTALKQVEERRAVAAALLEQRASDLEAIRQSVADVAHLDPRLRCALPSSEPLTHAGGLPAAPTAYTLIAADGSQINPNAHAPLHYFLVNLGAIRLQGGGDQAPDVFTHSDLHVAEYTRSGGYSEEQVSLERDKGERKLVAELAESAAQQPIITLTDGPLELWGEKAAGYGDDKAFSEHLSEYLAMLEQLHQRGAATAGYVDKPRADLLVRMLEVLQLPEGSDAQALRARPLRGVTDAHLLRDLLQPGERSAVFGIQSQSAGRYFGHLALHFFYLNVGKPGAPWLARVEIPGWVASNPALLDALHAVVVSQSQILGSYTYPYVLHRAHEIALVKYEEHEQVAQLIINELRAMGVEPGELSQKQAAKNLPGRRRFTL